MKFKNKGPDEKVRLENDEGYYWITVRANQEVELSEELGKAYKFEEVKSKPVEKPVKSKVKKTRKAK